MDIRLLQCAGCLVARGTNLKMKKHRGGLGNFVSSIRFKHTRTGKSHYEVLELKPKATQPEIRAAFIKLSKEVHPDTNPNDPKNHSKFVRLNEAYTILAKPSSRREYDLTLAHRMYYDENLKRHGGYQAYSAGGGSYSPGSGTAKDQGFEAQQRAFWDETIWYMRDKSRDKDAFYSDDRYYGIKGIRRQSNSVILGFCFGVMTLGTVIFFLCLKYSTRKSREYIDKMDKKNLAIYNRTRENALKYTTTEQLNNIFKSEPSTSLPQTAVTSSRTAPQK